MGYLGEKNCIVLFVPVTTTKCCPTFKCSCKIELSDNVTMICRTTCLISKSWKGKNRGKNQGTDIADRSATHKMDICIL